MDENDKVSWVDIADLFAVSPDAVGRRIREARLTKKLSLADLGSCVGRSSQAVQQWEVGESEPGIERLVALSHHLEVEPIWLMTGVRALVNSEWVRKQRERARQLRARQQSDEELSDEDDELDDNNANPQQVTGKRRRLVRRVRGRRLPILDQKMLRAFDASIVADVADGDDVFSHFKCCEKSFAFEISDKRNFPDFQHGDVVVIDPEVRATPGAMILVKAGTEVVFGRLNASNESNVEVVALNSAWPTVKLGSYVELLDGRSRRLKGMTGPKDYKLIGVMSEHCSPSRE